MRVQIKPAHQIQRIHALMNQLKSFKELDWQFFVNRPDEKSWCGAEVMKHMIVAQDAYADKLDTTFAQLKPIEQEIDSLRTHAIPSFLIKRFPPKEGKIRFKMKTTKQFKPLLDIEVLTEQSMDDLLQEMQKSLDQLVSWVHKTRKADVRSIRFNSAIGPIVKFNVSEACEFILCHNERHFHQLQKTISTVKE